jgi:hypothetical protein
MRVVSNQNVIRRTRLKLIKVTTSQNKALATKRPEMRDRRLATKAKLKGGQVQNRAQEDSIRNIACNSNRIFPKASRNPMLIKNHPSHLNLSAVLSFHNSILLRNKRGGKLLINIMLKAKLIERGIPELDLIVIVNVFQVVGMFIVQPQSQTLKVLKHFIFTFQEENTGVTRIVINDDKNIPIVAHGVNPSGTDSVHMEQLFGLLIHHGVN